MARPAWPERSRSARSSRQLSRFYHSINPDRVFGTQHTPLCDFVVPFDCRGEPMIGSTDVADVSWVVPTVEARVATHAIGTPGHSWQIVAQGKSPAAHKGMVHAAKVMAATGIEA